MRKLFFVLLSWSTIAGYCQNYTVVIEGPTTASLGDVQQFSVVWRDGPQGPYVVPPTGQYTWSAMGGTINSSSNTQGSVTWTGIGQAMVYYEMVTWDNFYFDSHIVNVAASAPPTPNATFSITENCHQTIVTREDGNRPTYIEWFWQTSPSGTSTDFYGTSRTIESPVPLYLRARLSSSPFTWSALSQFIGDIQIVSPPPVPSSATNAHLISDVSDQVTLSVNSVTTATSYQWYTVASGGTRIPGVNGTSYSPNISQNSTYYVASVTGNCASTSRRPVTGYIHPPPIISATNNGRITLGAEVTLSVSYSYDTYQWKRNGSDVLGETEATYKTNTPGSYSVIVGKGNSALVPSPPQDLTTGHGGQNENYIVTNMILAPGVTEADVNTLSLDSLSQTTQYFDGLGRLKQTVTTQGSPGKLDVIQPVVYDEFGRESKRYLPYTNGTDGWFKADFNPESGPQLDFYQNTAGVASDNVPFSIVHFEASPLSRPLKEYGPGEAWSAEPGEDRFVAHGYKVNKHENGDEIEEIVAWNVDSNGQLGRADEVADYVEPGGFYSTGQISIKETTDEAGHRVREYTDKLGRLVLKKVQAVDDASVGDDDQWAQTYYIYDDFGNLVMVLPPEAVKALINQ